MMHVLYRASKTSSFFFFRLMIFQRFLQCALLLRSSWGPLFVRQSSNAILYRPLGLRRIILLHLGNVCNNYTNTVLTNITAKHWSNVVDCQYLLGEGGESHGRIFIYFAAKGWTIIIVRQRYKHAMYVRFCFSGSSLQSFLNKTFRDILVPIRSDQSCQLFSWTSTNIPYSEAYGSCQQLPFSGKCDNRGSLLLSEIMKSKSKLP